MHAQSDNHSPAATRRKRLSATRAPSWAAALWAGVIFTASSLPGSRVPGRFGSIAHFIEYAILGALLMLALRDDRDPLGRAALAFAMAVAYGITDEFHQAFVVGRVPDPLDLTVDAAGAACAVIAVVTALSLARRRSA